MRAPQRRARVALAVGLLAALVVPAVALAHPLGNFTINVYAGIRVSPGTIAIDAVLDQAEIPTFQERLRLDTDADGEVSDAEVAAAQQPECATLARGLDLSIDGARAGLELTATGLSFPSGAGGLSTMRLVCEFVAPLAASPRGANIEFVNRVHSERLGWREIVVESDGTTISAAEGTVRSVSVSRRLTSYPADLLAQPLAESAIAFRVTPGGAAAPAPRIDDASPLPGSNRGSIPAGVAAPPPAAGTATASIPGGVGADIPAIFRAADTSPAVILLALATAVGLGAAHALTPGHGKTLMAAYLVGTRGTAVHAAGLGLSVTVSHTLGILALAALVTAGQAALPPDVVVRAMPAVAAVTIVAIGGWMLVAELRRRRAREHAHDGRAQGADEPAHEPAHDHDQEHEHEHGGVRHSHLPPSGGAITWRSLFALGLAGGIIPSTSALLILLGTVAAGRAAFGVVLVVAFGLGMALVMTGVGLVMVRARRLLERLPARSPAARVSSFAPLLAATVVFALGLWLTGQAIAGRPVL